MYLIKKPLGADLSDYFNYGFTEESWKQYCEKQRRVRMELHMQKKIQVSAITASALPKRFSLSLSHTHRFIRVSVMSWTMLPSKCQWFLRQCCRLSP